LKEFLSELELRQLRALPQRKCSGFEQVAGKNLTLKKLTMWGLQMGQESSADVVQAALSLGASGYVVKDKAANDLRAVVEAVLAGNTFVSSSYALLLFITLRSSYCASRELRARLK
jgi:hypothetical protein